MVYYIEMWDVRYPKGADFWQRLQSMFEWASDDFLSSSVQTYEEALGMDDHARNEGTGHAEIIPYRRTGDHDNLLYFHQMGVDLIPQLAPLLAKKTLSNELFLKWSELMFCHGWISSVRFSEGDDLGSERGSRKSAEVRDATRHRCFVASHLLPLLNQGVKRKEAEQNLEEMVQAAISQGESIPPLTTEELKDLLTDKGYLKPGYGEKKLTKKEMKALLAAWPG